VHFPSLSTGGERPAAAEGSPPLWDMGLLGKEKSESGVAEKHFSLVRQI